MATAFHIKRDFPVVADDNGTYIQAVRGNGGDGDGLAAVSYTHLTLPTKLEV